MISGSGDEKIVMSEIVTRQHEATFEAHTGAVYVLAVSGRTLLSAGDDCTIGVWALGTWSHLRVVRISEHVPDCERCNFLAMSGSMLLCGGMCKDDELCEDDDESCEDNDGFVVVLDINSLTCQHTLQFDHSVEVLRSVRDEVWGRLWSNSVVVWGKAEQGEESGMREAGRA